MSGGGNRAIWNAHCEHQVICGMRRVSQGAAARPSEDTERSGVPQRPLSHRSLSSCMMKKVSPSGLTWKRLGLPLE
jgi:hypothetical protein